MARNCQLICHRRLLKAVVISLALHGVAFLSVTTGGAEKPLMVAGRFFGTRLAPLDVVFGRDVRALEGGEVEGGEVVPTSPESPLLTAKQEMLDRAPPLTVQAAVPVAESHVVSPVEIPRGSSVTASGPRSADYLPTVKLSVAATPLGEINLPWPAKEIRLGRFCAVFTLFVDEGGVVQNIVADGPTLTPLMEETTRQVFMQARFSPAMLNGYPVKAMQRIEVVFESSSSAPNQMPQVVLRNVL